MAEKSDIVFSADELEQLYSDLYASLGELKDSAPTLLTIYDSLKAKIETINNRIKSGEIMIDEQIRQIEEQNAVINDQEKALERLEARIKKLQESIDKNQEKIEKAGTKSMSSLESQGESMLREITTKKEAFLDQTRELLEQLAEATGYITKDIDYEEVTSIEALQEKYGNYWDHPIIVEKKGENPWTNDYCFAVEEVKGSRAIGQAFVNGEPYGKKRTYPANSPTFSMYEGPSIDAILGYYGSDD